VSELEADVEGARQAQTFDMAGSLLGVLTGRKSTRAITGTMRRRQATRSKEQRLTSAQEKAMDKWNAIQQLEQDLNEDLEEINDTWEDIALNIEEVDIGLEKTDISIDDFVVVWIPA
jgi:chromosome segregation ATPase